MFNDWPRTMEINPTCKVFFRVCWLFLICSVFTLAKTLHDAQELLMAETRLDGRRAAGGESS